MKLIPLLIVAFVLVNTFIRNGDPVLGIVGAHAKIQEECTVRNDGEIVCEKRFQMTDFDNDSSDEDEEDEAMSCQDTHGHCAFWAQKGECTANPGYMLIHCAKSCNECSPSKKSFKPDRKYTVKSEKDHLIKLSTTIGEKQEANGSDELFTLLKIRESLLYMENYVKTDKPTHRMSANSIESCKNKNALCSFWAFLGECENNMAFMTTNCGPACQSCHKIDYNTRCPPRDANAEPAWKPGDLNSMFENIVRNDSFQTTVHSRPNLQAENNQPHRRADLENDPWIITVDNFLSDDECDKLIELGYQHEYTRSKDVGPKMNADGTFDGYENDRRTSKNAWCSELKKCRQNETVQRIHSKIQDLTNISQMNSEDLQILKYEEGEFYRKHHDYINHQRDRQNGPRILTVFLYLSDVEEGGGTAFPDLMHTIHPRKGRALLWPSVLNSDPSSSDDRMMHEALEVIKGKKYAANAWIHLYDNVTLTRIGCT